MFVLVYWLMKIRFVHELSPNLLLNLYKVMLRFPQLCVPVPQCVCVCVGSSLVNCCLFMQPFLRRLDYFGIDLFPFRHPNLQKHLQTNAKTMAERCLPSSTFQGHVWNFAVGNLINRYCKVYIYIYIYTPRYVQFIGQ